SRIDFLLSSFSSTSIVSPNTLPSKCMVVMEFPIFPSFELAIPVSQSARLFFSRGTCVSSNFSNPCTRLWISSTYFIILSSFILQFPNTFPMTSCESECVAIS
ncbi:Unknown protein, partial [Striga hermonthica]